MPAFPSVKGNLDQVEVFFDESRLIDVLRRKKPTKFFWCDMTDMFGSWVPFEWIDKCFAVMALTPQHIHQVLTKRPERMAEYFADRELRGISFGQEVSNVLDRMWPDAPEEMYDIATDRSKTIQIPGWWAQLNKVKDFGIAAPSNVWLGTSCEDQKRADERIPHLLRCPASVRFLSCEPLLGSLNLEPYLRLLDAARCPKCSFYSNCDLECPNCKILLGPDVRIDWVIVGGESGPKARPMHPVWARSLLNQCKAFDVPFFFKQWGEWAPDEALPTDFDKDYFKTGIKREYVDLNGDFDSMGLRDGIQTMNRVGKKRAGRLLEGREWNEFPDVNAPPRGTLRPDNESGSASNPEVA